MKEIKVAIVGCSDKVDRFVGFINGSGDGKVVAVWDASAEHGKEIEKRLGIPFEADYDKLVSDYDLDGVMIMAPNVFHHDFAIKAANKGISVFVEKPLCVTQKDAEEVRDAINANNVKFYMSDPMVRQGTVKLKELIDAGELGKITGATIRHGSNQALKGFFHYERDLWLGGIMADVGSHAFHRLHYLLGMPNALNAELFCVTERSKETGMEEKALINFYYDDDITVSFEASVVSGGASGITAVYGTKAAAFVETAGNTEGQEKLTIYKYDGGKEVFMPEDLPPVPTRHVLYFLEMIRNDYPNDIVGRDPLSNSGVSLDNAVEYARMIETVYKNDGKGKVNL